MCMSPAAAPFPDSYLYSMAKTYMMNIPLIANGLGGNQSTFHQVL